MSRVAPYPTPGSTSSSASRPIAPLPHHYLPHPHPQQTPASASAATCRAPVPSAYTSDARQLQPGGKNGYFLSLRSGIEEEVDHALPRLVVASYEYPESFILSHWVDSVSSLREWPEKWLDHLEKEAAALELRSTAFQRQLDHDEVDNRSPGQKQKRKRDVDVDLALGAIPEWTFDPLIETRATNSLLVLRNASHTPSNTLLICRKPFLSFIERFFSLPTSFILEISLRSPEPLLHLLTIIQHVFPHILSSKSITPQIKIIFGTVLPELLVQTRDSAMMFHILPLLISGMTIPNMPFPPNSLIPHLLQLLVLRPSVPLLELELDLLISLTLNPVYARSILSQDAFPKHLKSLVMLLEYGGRQVSISWEVPRHNTNSNSMVIGGGDAAAKTYRNPAGNVVTSEQAESQRASERALAQRNMEVFGGPGVFVNVGDKPPPISQMTKNKLYTMREPARSISWMHETFVYSSTSQLLQVTFWHAYRDFFTNPATVEQLLSASDVIKNVTVAFPGASARVIQDEMGGQKFVIAGMGFRKPDDSHRFACLWQSCYNRTGSSTPSQLLSHIQTNHLNNPSNPNPNPNPTNQCQWYSCTHYPASLSHILTHLPLVTPVNVPDHLTSHPSENENSLLQRKITNRRIPPLPITQKLHYHGLLTPNIPAKASQAAIASGSGGGGKPKPTSVSFLASIIIRNLARTLKNEISISQPVNIDSLIEAKKKHLLEERFGLPIPENVLKEEEEEERQAGTTGVSEKEKGLSDDQRERARDAFVLVEQDVLGVIENNVVGLGEFLGEAFGW